MERNRFGEPLTIGVHVFGDACMEASAALAIADAGHRRAGTVAQANLLIILVDSVAPGLATRRSGISQSRPVPILAFVNNALLLEAQAWLTSSSHDVRSVVYFEGSSDLRWKVAQTLAGYLSGCFRESLRLQRAIIDTTTPPDFASMVALAVHPDLQVRRLAARLIDAYLSRTPAGTEPLATSLLATGKTASFPAVAQVLRFVNRADPGQARALLTNLLDRSPAFLTWLVGRDS